jgi:hypothetical protein
MANPDTPFGLRPVRHLNGHPWNGQAMRCWCAGGNATALFLGDPVYMTGTACANGCCPAIDLRATTTTANPLPWLGPVVGVEPSTATSVPKLAVSTTGYLNVVVDPYVIYEIQDDNNTGMAITSVGLNAVWVAGAGSAVTYLSGHELDSGSTTAPAADCTFHLMIIGGVDRSDNDISLGNFNWLVLNAMSHFNSFGDSESATTAASRGGLLGV